MNIKSVITGSAQPQITRTSLFPVNFLIPHENILLDFIFITRPNVSQRQNLIKQNHQLIELRDWLLPMLMNGAGEGEKARKNDNR